LVFEAGREQGMDQLRLPLIGFPSSYDLIEASFNSIPPRLQSLTPIQQTK
jgi:hypothetical protein